MMANISRSKASVSTLVILAAFLFANLLTVAPQLHEKVHGSSVNHECAATIVASGKYELSAAPPLAQAPQPLVEFPRAISIPAVSIPALFLSAAIYEHAPPAIS